MSDSSSVKVFGAALFGFASVVAALNYSKTLKPKSPKEEEKEEVKKFQPTKNLCMKDMFLIKMLEDNEGVAKGFAKPCWVIVDPDMDDSQIIHCSAGFCNLTLYTEEEIVGRNCRFLQGPLTTTESVDVIRDAIKKQTAASVCLLNYKKDGTPFLNQFYMCPLFDVDGKLAYYVGSQVQVPTQAEDQEFKNIAYCYKAYGNNIQ